MQAAVDAASRVGNAIWNGTERAVLTAKRTFCIAVMAILGFHFVERLRYLKLFAAVGWCVLSVYERLTIALRVLFFVLWANRRGKTGRHRYHMVNVLIRRGIRPASYGERLPIGRRARVLS